MGGDPAELSSGVTDARASIETVFDDEDVRSYAEPYLEELRANWREAERSLSRTILTAILVGALFLLLTQGGAQTVSFPFVSLKDATIVMKALPMVIAYLSWTVCLLIVESSLLHETHQAVVASRWPTLYEKNLETALFPGNRTLEFPARFFYSLPPESRLRKWLDVFTFVRVLPVMVGFVGFAIWAFVVLFGRFGFADVFVWISLVVSGVMYVGGTVTLVAGFSVPEA
ncbi:MAG: hypothetical protein ABR613_12010 [Actinomycetota bacterium]